MRTQFVALADCHQVPTKAYDIAFLETVDPFPDWTANLKAVLLNTVDPLPVGMDCDVSGWGKTKDVRKSRAFGGF